MALARHRRRSARSIGLLRQTGRIERADPIPPGVYWLDVIWEPAQDGVRKDVHFGLWLDAVRAAGFVKLLKSVHHEGVQITNDPPRDWMLFQVLSPAPRWTSETGLGLPTVAPEGLATVEEDTIQSPPSPSFWDSILPDTTSGRVIVIGAGLFAGGLVLYGITRR